MITLLLDVFELVVRVAPKKSAVICDDAGVVHFVCVGWFKCPLPNPFAR
jgi:hypothetical protein